MTYLALDLKYKKRGELKADCIAATTRHFHFPEFTFIIMLPLYHSFYSTLTPRSGSAKKNKKKMHKPTTHPWTINSLLEVPAQSRAESTTTGEVDN